MLVSCSHCNSSFDSHEGGTICSKCQEAFCPKCEVSEMSLNALICLKCRALLISQIERRKSEVPIPPELIALSAEVEFMGITLLRAAKDLGRFEQCSELLELLRSWNAQVHHFHATKESPNVPSKS